MSHLILGGTGTVGSAVVRGLLARGEEVRVLTRSAERAAALPEGARAVIGDLGDPSTYEQVFAGARTLFLLNGVVSTELQEGLAAVNEARRAGIGRIVYLSVHDVEKGPHVPHFASKLGVERAIEASGIPFTILRPNNFYQNDFWYQDVITRYGIYPQPIGNAGLSRVDVRDIAEAGVNALTQDGHEGEDVRAGGPRAGHRRGNGGRLGAGAGPRRALRRRRPGRVEPAGRADAARVDGVRLRADVRALPGAGPARHRRAGRGERHHRGPRPARLRRLRRRDGRRVAVKSARAG